MLAVRADLWATLVVDQGRKKSTGDQRDDQRHRHFCHWLVAIPIPDDCANQYGAIGHLPIQDVRRYNLSLLHLNGRASCDVVLYEQLYRQSPV